MAKWVMGVQLIDEHSPRGDHERFVLEETYRLAHTAGLKGMPQVGIYHSQEVNAFATGPSKKTFFSSCFKRYVRKNGSKCD